MFQDSSQNQRIAELEMRIQRLEQQVDLILGRMGYGDVASRTADSGRMEELLRQGKKIEAIKIYREQTGVGLKEAKDAVDDMERRMLGR